MALPLNSIIEFTLRGELTGSTILNVFHYAVTTTSSIGTVRGELDQFLDHMSAAGAGSFLDDFLACSVGNYILREMTGQAVWPTRHVRRTQEFNQAGVRGNAGSANLAAVITKRTDLSGRKQVGSVHIAGLTAADYAGGDLQLVFIGALAAFADDVKTVQTPPVGGGAYTPCLWHRPPGPGTFNAVTEAIVQPSVRVMRRRTKGIGI